MGGVGKSLSEFINKIFPSKGSFRIFLVFQVVILFLLFIRFYNQEESPLGFTNSISILPQNSNLLQVNSILQDSKKKDNKNLVKIRLALANGDGVILTEIKEAIPTGEELIIPEGKNFGGNDTSLILECVAEFPVTWTYDGYEAPRTPSLKSFRETSNFNDFSTYKFHSILDFGKANLHEYNTGKYKCFGLMKENQNESSHFYIFVPGEEKLLQQGSSLEVISHDVFTDGPKATIPCIVSDPSVVLQLYKGNSKLEIGKSVFFNPTIGFQITLSDFNNPWANYTCKLKATGKSRTFALVKSPTAKNYWAQAGEVQVDPNSTSVRATGSQPTLFECEANEEIKISFADGISPSIAYDKAEEGDLGFQYRASFIVMPWILQREPLSRGLKQPVRPTIFQCQKLKDGTVLHTWEYSTDSSDTTELVSKVELSFNRAASEFRCCQKDPLQDNTQPPVRLTVTPCTSISECDLKTKFLKQNNNDINNNRTPDLLLQVDHSCVNWTPTRSLSFGAVNCKSVRSFNQLHFFSQIMEDNSTEYSLLDTEGHDMSSEIASLLVQVIEETATSKNQETSTIPGSKILILECSGSSFYFSGGFVWNFQRNETGASSSNSSKDGATLINIKEEYIPPFYVSTATVSVENIKSSSVSSDDILICNAPLWNSKQWKSIVVNLSLLKINIS